MKKIKRYIFTVLAFTAACMVATGCTDYLNKAPESEISEEEAFKNFKNFQGFVEEMYCCIPNFTTGYWNNSFNWGDDEIISVGINYMMGYKVDQGDFWGWQAEYDGWGCGFMDVNNDFDPNDPNNIDKRPTLWKAAWYAIRKANLGLSHLDLLTEATQEQKNIIKGQLLFFRGFFHFQLMQYFGGLPYIDEVLASGNVNRARLSYDECANKAADDLREAADLLPINWDNTATGAPTRGNNELRANKIMALGYLGKNLLWAGSPLMNKSVTGSTSYNQEFCKRAAEAFGELLTLVETGQTQYSLVDFENYKELFLTHNKNGLMPGLTEAILRCPVQDWNRSNWGQTQDYGGSRITGRGEVVYQPCANYVKFYGMANGLPLDDPDSGFDKSHPWKDRDPRFYHDIRFDGCKMVLKSDAADAEPVRWAPLYTGGRLRHDKEGSRTGYFNYKFVRDDFNQWDQQGYENWSAHNHMLIPYMRLADIYLMYAESACNATGAAQGKSSNCSLSAVDAINKVRARAGVDPVNAKYTASLEGFMSEVRRERAVELAFEAHRFNDLRRWLLLDKYPYNVKTSQEFQRVGDLTGVETDSSIGVNTENPKESQVIGFTEKEILTRNYSEKHYWLPLKISDTNMSAEFGQNPGW